MNPINELSNIEKSPFFQQALTRLHIDINNFVTHVGLEVYFDKRKKPTLETPFYFDQLSISDEWIEKHLSKEDNQKVKRLKEINEFWHVHLYSKKENPNGVHLSFFYLHYEGYEKIDLSFLMEFGNESIQQKYRLIALFAEDGKPMNGIFSHEYQTDINYTGKQLAQELSDKLTKLLIPIRNQIEARIQLFQQEIKQLY